MPIAPEPPADTPEYTALEPRADEAPMDALARVGAGVLDEFGGGDEHKDARKNKQMPKQLGALVALRAQGFDNAEIAKKLGVTPRKLTALIAKARKEYGWSDLEDRLVHVAVPKAMDNVIKHLDHESSEAAQVNGQHLMTRTVLGGVGVFRTHTAVKQTSKNENLNVMRIEILMPEKPEGLSAGPVAGVLAAPRRAVPSGAAAALPPAVLDGEIAR